MQNRLVLTYVISFIIIVGVVVFNKVKIQNDAMEAFKNDPRVITLATNQAALTQSIAKSTLAISYAPNQTSFDRIKSELAGSYNEWKGNHDLLRSSNPVTSINPNNDPQVGALIDDLSNNLNLISRSVDDVLELNYSDPQDRKDIVINGAINGVLSRERRYNNVMNSMIDTYTKLSSDRIDGFSLYYSNQQ
jgi:hypothetical protein